VNQNSQIEIHIVVTLVVVTYGCITFEEGLPRRSLCQKSGISACSWDVRVHCLPPPQCLTPLGSNLGKYSSFSSLEAVIAADKRATKY